MKKFIKSIAVAVVVSSMLLANAVMAAEQKIGTVNVQLVVSQLPQMAVIQETLKSEFKDQMANFEKLRADLNYNVEKRKRDSAIMSKSDIDALEVTLNTQNQQYQQTGQALQEAMKRRENEERNKILALVKQAIDSVAKRDNYDLILSQTAVAYAKENTDISSAVVEQVSNIK